MGAGLIANAASIDTIPKAVITSLDRNQIPRDAISISVIEIEPQKTGKQITKTIIFNPPSTNIKYLLDNGKEYDGVELEFDKELSRDNRLKDLNI